MIGTLIGLGLIVACGFVAEKLPCRDKHLCFIILIGSWLAVALVAIAILKMKGTQ